MDSNGATKYHTHVVFYYVGVTIKSFEHRAENKMSRVNPFISNGSGTGREDLWGEIREWEGHMCS